MTYDVNGGTGTVTDSNSYTYGDNVNVKFDTVPQKQGCTFAGWNTKQDGTGTSYTADGTKSFEITGNTTLYAQWETDKYTVIYTDGSGSEAYFEDQKTENLAYNADTPAFNGTPTRPGYTFKGWSPSVDAKVTKNATYTATWTQDKYKVTYDVNGGTGTVTDSNSYTYGDNVNVKFDTVPQKQGCTFAGWNTKQDGTGTSYTKEGTTTFQITGNTTLYAQWKTDKYTVIYTDGSGSEAYFVDQKTENLAYNQSTPAFSGKPTRPGYSFNGWSPALDAKVTKDATYTATWSQDKYKVTYDVNGGTGTVTDSTLYTYENTVSVLFGTLPQKQGFTFAGWNTKQDGTGTSYTAEGTKSFQITGNITLYAQWEKPSTPAEQPPKTGDTSHIELWLSLSALSLLTIGVLLFVQKRFRTHQSK